MTPTRTERQRVERPCGALALTVLLGLTMTSTAATAQESGAGRARACLFWDISGARVCPTAKDVQVAVDEVLDRQSFGVDRCEIEVRGSMRPTDAGGWRVTLEFFRADGSTLGTRELEGSSPDCGRMLGPISLAIALMVEATEVDTTVRAPLPEPASAPPPSRDRVSPFAWTRWRTAWGLLPEASMGGSVGLGLGSGKPVAAAVEGTFWLPQTTVDEGRGGRFRAWHAGVSVCYEPAARDAGFRPMICGGPQVGEMLGRGLGLDDNRRTRRVYAHGEARVAGVWTLGRSVALSAHVGLAAPWLRPRFVYRDDSGVSRQVHRPAAVVPIGGVGVEWASRTPRSLSTSP